MSNESIAIFMNLERHPNNQRAYWIEDQSCYLTFDNLQFHKSWDQLMPVIEKINSLRGWNLSMFSDNETVIFDDNFKMTASGRVFRFKESTRILSTYKAVVAFIEYYNTTTHQDQKQL